MIVGDEDAPFLTFFRLSFPRLVPGLCLCFLSSPLSLLLSRSRSPSRCLHVICVQVPEGPTENLILYFPQCNACIQQAILEGGKILVHCNAGLSRSAAVVVAYVRSRCRSHAQTHAYTHVCCNTSAHKKKFAAFFVLPKHGNIFRSGPPRMCIPFLCFASFELI